MLVANKTEGMDAALSLTDSYELGLGPALPIAALHSAGLTELVLALFPEPTEQETEIASETAPIKLAIVGSPQCRRNSTRLPNRLLGRTTRDCE